MKKLLCVAMAILLVAALAPFASAEDEFLADSFDILQFDVLPEIDGAVTVAEWGEPTRAHIKYPDNAMTDIADDAETDLEFTVWFRYTFDGFYAAIQTPDTSNFNQYVDSSSIWNGDCIQMRIDPWGCTYDQGLVPDAARDANYSGDYQEFAFALGDDGECYAYCWSGIMAGIALSSEGGQYAAGNDGTTTTYEVYIPWEELVDENPHVGMSYGISVCRLSATDGDYENWLEWGAGVINGRDENIVGTHRMTFSATTVHGGASLEDPNPVGEITTKPPVQDATGDAVLIDITKLSGANGMSHEVNDDGSVTFAFEDGGDPYISLAISSQVRVDAETYPYFAMYLKTNDYTDGEMFYVTSDCGVGDFTGGYSVPFYYYEVEGNQSVVVDFSDNVDWLGNVTKLRYDAFNGGPYDYEESSITMYAAGFFKTLEAAEKFQVEGYTVDLDPAVFETEAPGTDAPETNAPVVTDAPKTDTTAEPAGTDAATGTKAPDPGKPADGNNGWIIWVIVGVVVVAAVVVVVIIVTKKKK